jgi:hypothetical protein
LQQSIASIASTQVDGSISNENVSMPHNADSSAV